MQSELNQLKGNSPGLVLERELNKRHLSKGSFALSLQEYRQTVINQKKNAFILAELRFCIFLPSGTCIFLCTLLIEMNC
jgi:hypothetical protein